MYWLLVYALTPLLQVREKNTIKKKTFVYTPIRYLALFLFLLIFYELISLLSFIPDIRILKNDNPQSTSIMRFRKEDPQPAPGFLPLGEIPELFIKGVLACEDYDFYSHKGFSPSSIKFAFSQNIKQRAFVYGGSTITQQLARTLFLTPRKTIYRKYRELFIAVELELFLSKDRILELYMNYAEWGPDTYGVYDASLYHFGKDFSSLDLREYADLLSILPNPLRWDTDTYKQSVLLTRRWKKICTFYNIEPMM